ncbi:MAG: PIN domain-containing protein [Victivallales bacterium]|jgi:predicted nucleic acid-binding protein
MKEIYVDANVFLRFVLWDPPELAGEAEKFFRNSIEGREKLVTSDLVIAEIVWTLESFYEKSKSQIAEFVQGILSTPNLTVENADLVAVAVKIYEEKNVDFIDAYSYAYMKKHKISGIKTFDRKHFKRFPDIEMT